MSPHVRNLPGVLRANINYSTAKLYVEYKPDDVDIDQILRAVKTAGYRTGQATIQLGVGGMHCASCVDKIESELRKCSGVVSASVDLGTESVVIDYLPNLVNLRALKAIIEKLGYRTFDSASPGTLSPKEQKEPVDQYQKAREREYRKLLVKFLVAGILALPVVLFSYPTLFGLPAEFQRGSETLRRVWMVMGLLALPVMAR